MGYRVVVVDLSAGELSTRGTPALRAEEARAAVRRALADYDDWLACPVAEASRFFRQWAGDLVAQPDVLLRPPSTQSSFE